jgi:DNA adenine methylase
MSANVSPVAWYGGKSRLAAWIAGLIPRHDSYVEVFGGGAAVLFAKPRARLEVYNDIDEGLVTFFRLLRDRPSELQQALRLTPYARSEFEHRRDSWELVDDELERARRWYARTQMAFACSASSGWGFEVDGAHSGGTRASGYATAVENLHRFAERFRRVQVDQLDWHECLARYDRPGAVLYLDPPYHPDTRGRDRRNAYRHDLDAGDHEQLLARAVELKASVLISGYPHPLYDRVLEAAGFERYEHAHNSTAARSLDGRGAREPKCSGADSRPAPPTRCRYGRPIAASTLAQH